MQAAGSDWLDMAFALPLLDSSHAFRELDWSPSVDAMTVFHEVISGILHRDADATPVLRRRNGTGAMRDVVSRISVGQRNRA